MAAKFDLVCIGAVGAEMHGTGQSHFEEEVGGRAARTALACRRLGLHTALLGLVGADPMGKRIKEKLEAERIDTEGLVQSEEIATPIALLSDATHEVLFKTVHLERPEVKDLPPTRAVVLLGPQKVTLGEERLILDLEGVDASDEKCQEARDLLSRSDVLVGNRQQLLSVSGCEELEEAVAELKQMVRGVVVYKRGEQGSIVYSKQLEEPVLGRPYHVDVESLWASADAFLAGFLRSYLRNHNLRDCCTVGNANAAILLSRSGAASALPSWEELSDFIERESEMPLPV